MRSPLSLPQLRTTLAWETVGSWVWAKRVVREVAAHDVVVLLYYVGLWIAALQGAGAERDACLSRTAALVVVHLLTLLCVRGGILRHGFFAPMLYRLVVYGGVQASYFLLRDLLPLAVPHSVDATLYQLDRSLFGQEPTLWADQFVNSRTTEWFSFFYFNYFFLLAVHVIPLVFFSRRLYLAAEFALGFILIFCVGHILYMLVPGYGPYHFLASVFKNDLPRGLWYDMVRGVVASCGAQKDIFPSLHTAAPTFIAVFSFFHRDKLPFRYTWPVVGFFALNIMGATVFLRWHYLIDVVAGITLAFSSAVAARYLSPKEQVRRQSLGLTLAWPSFFHRRPVDAPPDP